ncbi:MAG: hypothetical protein KBD24_03820 [Candidatus Pacebacteria bacterium]|nr:hypothetical protein [Candidatus Paceibacterota bacterium]
MPNVIQVVIWMLLVSVTPIVGVYFIPNDTVSPVAIANSHIVYDVNPSMLHGLVRGWYSSLDVVLGILFAYWSAWVIFAVEYVVVAYVSSAFRKRNLRL